MKHALTFLTTLFLSVAADAQAEPAKAPSPDAAGGKTIVTVSKSATDQEPIAGVRTATVVVAAADAPDHLKKAADAVCPGQDDHLVINAAIASLPETGGRVHLTGGSYRIGAAVQRSSVLHSQQVSVGTPFR